MSQLSITTSKDVVVEVGVVSPWVGAASHRKEPQAATMELQAAMGPPLHLFCSGLYQPRHLPSGRAPTSLPGGPLSSLSSPVCAQS